MVVREHLKRDASLPELARASRPLRLKLSPAQGGQEQCGKDSDYRHDDQQFDQRKSPADRPSIGAGVHQ